MNKTYFQLEIEELNKLKSKKKLLLHSCCAPCSSHVITFLTKFFDITVLYYNPNISPKREYDKRKEEQIRLIKEIEKINKVVIIDCDYDNDKYETLIKGYEDCPERGDRCTICFNLRLEKTAKLAKELKYDYFCSTLSVSPYKNSKLINEIGEELSKKYNVYIQILKKMMVIKNPLNYPISIIYIDKTIVDVNILLGRKRMNKEDI